MKKYLLLLISFTVLLFSSCEPQITTEGSDVVFLPTGPTVLEDARFGVYYGDINYDGIGIYAIVLSDARCYQDNDEPYLDSEGDLLVLELRGYVLEEGAEIVLPEGDYVVSDENVKMTINAKNSYVKRFVGSTQYKWNIKSGSISVKKDNNGNYDITTSDLVITDGREEQEVQYTCNTSLSIADYLSKAPGLIGQDDDIIDLPFTNVTSDYYGNLYGYGTGNFVITMTTKDLLEDETGTLPGVMITINVFSKLYAAGATPIIEAGRYNITSITSDALFARWTLLPGVLMDSTPFGTYLYQQVKDGSPVLEYISSGYIDVSYDEEDEEICTLVYDFKTSSRSVSGTWKGKLPSTNYAEDNTKEPLSTLEHDVACDMSKAKSAVIRHIETLHRDNVEAMLDYDIAEAWQVFIQPRDWTTEEYEIPYNKDEGQFDENGNWIDEPNGISDRIDHWCADGDVMVLEFILPLECDGNPAPELNREYTYTMQPNLAMNDYDYETCVSAMGRPDDTVFDPKCAHFGYSKFMTGYDYCNGRRGFTWSEGGFRGNWYLHYEENRHFILDGHAPAINGTVTVTRTSEIDPATNVAEFKFEWDFIDDALTPNSITGSWTGPVTISK